MKKLFISMVALVAVLASCSKSNVVEVPYENIPISFSSYNGKIPTVKSSAFVGVDSLAEYGFQVYGYLHNYPSTDKENYSAPSYAKTGVYMDKTVTGTKEGETWKWQYDGMSYWPGTLYLDFVAYGLNASSILTTNNENTNVLQVDIPSSVAEQKDLLVATPHKDVQYAAKTADGGGNDGTVALKFNHLLSRVSFALVTKANNGVNVTIQEITLGGKFNTTGTVDLTQGPVPTINATTAQDTTGYNFLGGKTFTSTGDTQEKGGADIYDNSMLWTFNPGATDESGKNISSNDDTYDAVAVVTDPGDQGSQEEKEAYAAYQALKAQAEKNMDNRYMMIMPTNGSDHKAKLYVKYFLPEAGSYAAKEGGVDLSTVDFQPGKSYKFLLKVSTNTIDFSVEVTDWVDAESNPETTQLIELN